MVLGRGIRRSQRRNFPCPKRAERDVWPGTAVMIWLCAGVVAAISDGLSGPLRGTHPGACGAPRGAPSCRSRWGPQSA
jgi:hypothetical protein